MECQTLERYDENLNPVLKNKKKFDTLDLAIEQAKKINSKDHIIHKVVAYKCSKCHKYHIGRNGKKLKEKERTKFKNTLSFK
jgi:predicted CXXCH cytochrome family protein